MFDLRRLSEAALFLRFFPSPEPFPMDRNAATDPATMGKLPGDVEELEAAGMGNMLPDPSAGGAVAGVVGVAAAAAAAARAAAAAIPPVPGGG